MIELPYHGDITYYSITTHNGGRVSTIAGNGFQGHHDGVAEYSSFFDPSGLFITSDNIVHVVESASCRVRRITPIPLAAQALTCDSTVLDIIRPSGCTSFDQPLDKV